ncbi:flagellar biosynthetic protein FliO [Rhizobium herbae]|uniref:Flagellar biosynthetic protein FliO n=1 Tax=Rhizobium herbae TaxID=508661 RepID=A0ABS7H6L5_9HYPH|nr:flagellar biosynthetic protein FliO [Rhizobium herbae]MBW9062099.1 flagellar biosynthetic protein FliO [Rhizobium herbae]
MIEDIVGNNGTRFIIAAGAVALGLFCLVAVLWFIRNRPSSPFIRGGKNRQPRLAVLDAAAVDTRRRLVLVRRDDVEHLIMIGGPTDIVIESRIGAQPAPQAGAASSLPEAIAASPVAERRAAPAAETRTAPVSAMGQVLYGENIDQVPAPTARGAQLRAQPEVREAVPERMVAQPRLQPVTSNTIPTVAVERAGSPEDILDAARTRVLAATPPASGQRPLTQTNPVPVASATQTTQPAPSQRDSSVAEFERILDAQITGDLGKLTADDVRVDQDQRANAASQSAMIRQEPRLGSVAGARTEPTLEDEMNRMLNEIAVNRKN